MNEYTPPNITETAQKNIETLFESFDFDSVVSDISSGRFLPNADKLTEKIVRLFLGELSSCFKAMGMLILMIFICAAISNLQDSLERKNVSKAAGYACYVYMALIVSSTFSTASKYVYDTLRDITVLTQSIVPAISMLAISGGQLSLGTMSHPIVFFICSGMNALIKNVISPLVLARAAATMLGGMSENNGLNEFTELFSKTHKILLAFSMSIFSGILGVTKFASVSFDNLAARGIKFFVGTAVPVVGGSIAEAMGSVASSAMLIKNSVGIAGIIMLFAMFGVPLLKIGALSFTYRITAAVSAPVANKEIVSTIRKIGECIDMLFSSVACMGIIMIIALASLL